jgi:ABC-type multidrug transport system permease subunit
MRRHAFVQLILARLREFYREPEVVFWVYGFPLILAVGLGIAFSGGKPEPPAVDIQADVPSEQAQTLEKSLGQASLPVEIHSPEECRSRLKSGKTALFIVPGSNKHELVFDEARAESVLARYWVEAALLRSERGQSGPALEEVIISEPGSRYIDFLLPGLIGMNIMGGGLFGVGFVLVDMRVRKLFKRLLATPMNRTDFLLALFTARKVFLVPEMLLLLVAGWLFFGVPVRGNPLVLVLIMLIGALTFDSIGLLIGSRTEKTETASGLLNLVMLPSYLLSGVFFSSKRFPDAVQPVIQALPLTQLNDALREVMLEGMTLFDVAWRLGILCLWGIVPFVLALRWFKWR